MILATDIPGLRAGIAPPSTQKWHRDSSTHLHLLQLLLLQNLEKAEASSSLKQYEHCLLSLIPMGLVERKVRKGQCDPKNSPSLGRKAWFTSIKLQVLAKCVLACSKAIR